MPLLSSEPWDSFEFLGIISIHQYINNLVCSVENKLIESLIRLKPTNSKDISHTLIFILFVY